jgi:histidinol-phosphatase (PHP family)
VIVDYHMHLRGPGERIDHSPEAAEPFVETARSRGVDELGFTEHVYYFRQTAAAWEVPYHVERCRHDLDTYVDAVLESKRRGLPVKLGLEVDWAPRRIDSLREALSPYPWDYLLGSIHFIGSAGIDSRPGLVDELGVEGAWQLYFETLAELAESGLVDVLAHPDLIKIFGERSAEPSRLYERFVERLAPTGVCLEISTAGLHKPVGELYPDPVLLGLAREAGIPVTLASDAHASENVGRDFDRALELAASAGYETVTVFEGRTARQEPLG